MKLIVFSGLPGVGKSALAESVGRTLGIPVFAKDWLEATLVRCELTPSNKEKSLGSVGYELLTVLAERQLRLGQSVILDSVASTESIRSAWKQLSARYAAEWFVVECICSNEIVHRARLNVRQRHIPGWHELEWSEVERVRNYYVPWSEPHLVVDSVLAMDENVEIILAWLKTKKENLQ